MQPSREARSTHTKWSRRKPGCGAPSSRNSQSVSRPCAGGASVHTDRRERGEGAASGTGRLTRARRVQPAAARCGWGEAAAGGAGEDSRAPCRCCEQRTPPTGCGAGVHGCGAAPNERRRAGAGVHTVDWSAKFHRGRNSDSVPAWLAAPAPRRLPGWPASTRQHDVGGCYPPLSRLPVPRSRVRSPPLRSALQPASPPEN